MGEGIDLDQLVTLVPGDQRGVRAGRRLDAADPGDPRVVAGQRALQRHDLAELAAPARVGGEEVLALEPVLVGDRVIRAGVDDADAVGVGDGVARPEGLGEVVAGLQEEDVDTGTRGGAELHQHRVLHVRGDDELLAERPGRPREDPSRELLVAGRSGCARLLEGGEAPTGVEGVRPEIVPEREGPHRRRSSSARTTQRAKRSPGSRCSAYARTIRST